MGNNTAIIDAFVIAGAARQPRTVQGGRAYFAVASSFLLVITKFIIDKVL